MISLIPCYSLEDFSIYRKSSDVDEIFAAWSALYHPALVAHFGQAPKWEAAGSPSSGQPPRLVVIPPCAELTVPHNWIKNAEKDGAVVIRKLSSRQEILTEIFHRLKLSPKTGEPLDENQIQNELSQETTSALTPAQIAQQTLQRHLGDVPPTPPEPKPEPLPYDDVVETFLACGLCSLLEELLTRKLRYMSNLDQTSYNSRILEAAQAYVANNPEECEKNLQKAFDLLAQAKEYFFPTATKFLDFTWVLPEDLKTQLHAELKKRRTRNAPSNIAITPNLVKECQRNFPETFNLLKEEVEAKRVTLIGADKWEAPLYLLSPQEMARQICQGRDVYREAFGVAPTIFARREAGYAQIMPQILKLSGYSGVLARTYDGWTLLSQPTDRSQIRWQGRDGSTISALCKRPLNAESAEEILQLPDKIGNSYYSDDASAVIFEHRPNTESIWLDDLLRMDRYAPVLGKFYDVADYQRVTRGSGDAEKFVKDHFKTNFLTRSVNRKRPDVTSLWQRRRRLERLVPTIERLLFELRARTFKVKKNSNVQLLWDETIQCAKSIVEQTNNLLQQIDAVLLASEATDEALNNYDANTFDMALVEMETAVNALLSRAAEFLNLAAPTGAEEDTYGRLFVNATSSTQETLWQTFRVDDSDELDAKEQALIDAVRANLDATPEANLRVYNDQKARRRYYCLTLPAGASLWMEELNGLEYRFEHKPFCYTSEPLDINKVETDASQDADVTSSQRVDTPAAQQQPRGSFFRRFADKFRVDTPNSAAPQSLPGQEEQDALILAEYVELRHSPTEIEKFYRLRNDLFELKIDPTTGAVRRLTTLKTTGTFAHGLLRQPTLGNRFAWDVAMKLDSNLGEHDTRSQETSGYGYTLSAADKITVLHRGPYYGAILIQGRLLAPNGQLVAYYQERLQTRMKSPVIDVTIAFTTQIVPQEGPWDSYYACRFAWKDEIAEVCGGVCGTLIATERDYLQAPEAVDIRSDEKVGVTVLSAGLPYFRRLDTTRLDAILIPPGETRRQFNFSIGVDLDDPENAALDYTDAPCFVLEKVRKPKRELTNYLTLDQKNVRILQIEPLIIADQAADRLHNDFAGLRVTLLETHSQATNVKLKSFFPIEKVEPIDFNADPIKDHIPLANANLIELEFKPRQIRILKIYFK
ncbi:MAG: hypothetical protein Q4G03_04610 [Planctomycetia bacterium]|nr:hypothetical protein [Planctomycetia bacterium]